MAKTPTHYDRLGVARNAPDEVIRAAYKALAQKNHPDKNINNPAATAVMQEINLAYDVLSDPGKRGDYDARLALGETQERERAAQKRRPASAPSQYQQYAGVPVRSGSSFGMLFLVIVLTAALFVAVFLSRSFSVPSFLPGQGSSTELLEDGPIKETATYVPLETSPQELAACIFEAAKTYNLPAPLLLALLSAEGGSVGKKTPTAGPTHDLGLLQINSSWIPQLVRDWGVDEITALRRLRDNACINISVGAWILETALVRGGNDLRAGIALYRTLAHHLDPKVDNGAYVDRVIKLMDIYKSVRKPEDLLRKEPAGAK